MSDYEELRAYQEMLMCFDTPAYIQRSQSVEAEWNAVLSRCKKQRNTWLEIPLMRLAKLERLTDSDWTRFDVFAQPEAKALSELVDLWKPKLRSSINPATNRKDATRAADALIDAFNRFNQRWLAFIEDFDLNKLNQLRQDYNDYYVLEKECVVLSPKVAQWGFEPLPPATLDDLLKLFPLLHVPRRS